MSEEFEYVEEETPFEGDMNKQYNADIVDTEQFSEVGHNHELDDDDDDDDDNDDDDDDDDDDDADVDGYAAGAGRVSGEHQGEHGREGAGADQSTRQT